MPVPMAGSINSAVVKKMVLRPPAIRMKKVLGILRVAPVSPAMADRVKSALTPLLAQAEEWKFAIEEIPGSIMDSYAQEFKKRIEAKTNKSAIELNADLHKHN